MRIYSWNQFSKGAKGLANTLGIRRIKHTGSSFKGSQRKVVINWGSSSLPAEVLKCKVLNSPAVVSNCTNKVKFFETMQANGVSIPPFTTDWNIANQWLAAGRVICVRKIVNGHGGEGLEIVNPGVPLPRAPLYTQYIPKKAEYRVHVFNGQVIDIQQKVLKAELQGRQDINWRIRNLANGFIFQRQNVNAPQCVIQNAIHSFRASGLLFGAFDIIYNDAVRAAYVLEVNTAPGLEGTSLINYSNAFREFNALLHL